ncbi:AAA family ATPase [Sorangium sp. So ce131]|uniref:AAA family ATPase n=1 Tax=Sorangium sp. So ce131 TaxID=3133282 RepID=UPI003F6378D3
MNARIPIGISDFRKLRELGLEYVDKSHLLCELLDKVGTEVFLLPRPRRFGKTLNLSMLRVFLEKSDEDLSRLFADLGVWAAGDPYRAHFQRYPVLFLTFKDIKADTFEQCWAGVTKVIQALYREHRYLLDADRLERGAARDYAAVLDGTAGRVVYERALADMSMHLHRHHGQKVVILVDEYDAPIHAGYIGGYAHEVLGVFRGLLTGGLKDNPHLFKAVLTGVLRIAKESIFSGLNNIAAYSLLASEFSSCFGFTEPEVERLLEKAGRPGLLPTVRAWYNGYLFGGTVIYNPWSILNFIAREDPDPQPFWVSTSSNDLIKEQLERRAAVLQPDFEALLEGGSVERVLDENVALGDVAHDDDVLWSLLVFSGYLKAEKRSRGPMERPAHLLSIPNREVREVYTGTFQRWMKDRLRGHGGDLARLTRALLGGDAEVLEEQLQAFVRNLLSYHDAGHLHPEQVYQAFVVGLLAVLEPAYRVRSNRESGQGRPDVLLLPTEPGTPGVVLEMKVARPAKRTLEQALDEGIEQIRKNDYPAELRAAGALPVHAFAVAFDGKDVRVRVLESP